VVIAISFDESPVVVLTSLLEEVDEVLLELLAIGHEFIF